MTIFNSEILIIDDDELHLIIFQKKFQDMGYTNIQLIKSYNDAKSYLEDHNPEIIFCDYYLNDNKTGVDLYNEYLIDRSIPFVLVSSFYGEELLEKVQPIAPFDFISKTASSFELERIIKLSLLVRSDDSSAIRNSDNIYVRSQSEIVRIRISEIEYINIVGRFISIYSNRQKIITRSTLADILKKLPNGFIRIHQAYVINLSHLESINVEEWTLKVGNNSLPFSKTYKRVLMNKYYIP